MRLALRPEIRSFIGSFVKQRKDTRSRLTILCSFLVCCPSEFRAPFDKATITTTRVLGSVVACFWCFFRLCICLSTQLPTASFRELDFLFLCCNSYEPLFYTGRQSDKIPGTPAAGSADCPHSSYAPTERQPPALCITISTLLRS